jgi:hypothetical protein
MPRVAFACILVCALACRRTDAAKEVRPVAADDSPPTNPADVPPVTPPPDVDTSACATIDDCARVLATSRDREALHAASVWLASKGEAAAVEALGKHLAQTEFLARLDNVDEPSERTFYLSRVFAAFSVAPNDAVAELCRTLARNPEYAPDGARMTYLLQAAASVKPMSDETVALFVETNPQGFASANALTLAKNASPKALALLERMLSDSTFEVDDAVWAIHWGLLPVRTEETVLQMVTRMLARKQPAPVEIALVETMFDHRSAEWFGKVGNRPEPPPWSSASDPALKAALDLASDVRRRARLPATLRARVAETAKEIEAVRAAR